jgi:L-fuculose-phosphate aldolase
MSTTETRTARNPMAPPLPPVSPEGEIALLARMLYREGYDDHLAGHITSRQPDGSLLVNPFGLTWDELTASDIMRIDADGHVLEGRWTVTPAITLHVELHKTRDDIAVAVHNHPRWGTVWADLQRIPPVYDQTSALVAGEIALFDEYQGDVANQTNARRAVAALGQARMALLANHGVFVVATDVRQAHHRAVTLEWRCRQAWHVEAVGSGRPLDPDVHQRMGGYFDTMAFPGLWEAMVRRELRADPTVLD